MAEITMGAACDRNNFNVRGCAGFAATGSPRRCTEIGHWNDALTLAEIKSSYVPICSASLPSTYWKSCGPGYSWQVETHAFRALVMMSLCGDALHVCGSGMPGEHDKNNMLLVDAVLKVLNVKSI